MSKTIDTLVEDIYSVFDDDDILVNEEEAEGFGKDLSAIISSRINAQQSKGHLRLSSISRPCARQLWYEVNMPEAAEPLEPNAKLKFLFGDILECLLLFLAKKSGHEVRGQQDELEIDGVKGHRDAVIDGHLVDVKSASKFGYLKFKDGLKPEDDGFGYLEQLKNYHYASGDVHPETAHFLVIGKELGNICLDTHTLDTSDVPSRISDRRRVSQLKAPPERAYDDEPDGRSGNRKLKFNCAYCPFKKECWPGLRTFIYSNGPRFLTQVRRTPDVPEVKYDKTWT